MGSPPNFVGTSIHTSLFKVHACVGIKGPRRVPRLPSYSLCFCLSSVWVEKFLLP